MGSEYVHEQSKGRATEPRDACAASLIEPAQDMGRRQCQVRGTGILM
jgi:hypothetical protein